MRNDLVKELVALKARIGEGVLDEEVRDIFDLNASNLNNEGVEAQVQFLIDHYGIEDAITVIKDILS